MPTDIDSDEAFAYYYDHYIAKIRNKIQ